MHRHIFRPSANTTLLRSYLLKNIFVRYVMIMFGQDGKKCTFAVFNCPFIDLWVARRIQFSKLETQTLHFLHTSTTAYLLSSFCLNVLCIYVDTRKNGECKTAFPHLASCFFSSKYKYYICITRILTYRVSHKDILNHAK